MYEPIETGSRSRRTFTAAGRILGALKLDGPLLVGLGLITLYGLVVLYSASGQNWGRVIDGAIRAALGGFAMCALAQVKPAFLRRLAFPLWMLGVVLLVVVDISGHIGKGAQRWLDLGFIRFQPDRNRQRQQQRRRQLGQPRELPDEKQRDLSNRRGRSGR